MKHSQVDRIYRAVIALWVGLVCFVLAGNPQAAFAAMGPALSINAQLLDGPSSANRFIVRSTGGDAGINLTCLVLGCQVVEGVGDPDSQPFVVQFPQILSSEAFLSQLLAMSGVTDAEPDQTVNTLAATVSTMPSYAYDRTPVWYYGSSVWEGYLLQTPNQIVRTAQTQSNFGVSGQGTIVALIDTGVDPNNKILKSHLIYGYDFTRNADGGSEIGDINQSTAGVVDQSTAGVIDGSTQPATLNQSTAGVIDQSTAGVIDQTKYSAFGHGTMTAGI